MEFFGKNLKSRHKLTLCLVLFGILANGLLWSKLPQVPFVEYVPELGTYNFNLTQIVLALGTFIKMLVLCIFRKF